MLCLVVRRRIELLYYLPRRSIEEVTVALVHLIAFVSCNQRGLVPGDILGRTHESIQSYQ